MASAAAAVGWAATLGTLMQIIKPWRRRFAIVVGSGIARVAAFIGVGIIGALAVAAVKTGSPFGYLLDPAGAGRAARRAAALARILARARHRLSAAGGDADRAVRQARCPGAGLSCAAPFGRSDGARQPGRRDDRIFLRPHRGAGAGGGAGALDGADRPCRRCLADRPGVVALRAVCRLLRRC